jgi:hypothetical protein
MSRRYRRSPSPPGKNLIAHLLARHHAVGLLLAKLR